jgi:hypothetical protein
MFSSAAEVREVYLLTIIKDLGSIISDSSPETQQASSGSFCEN